MLTKMKRKCKIVTVNVEHHICKCKWVFSSPTLSALVVVNTPLRTDAFLSFHCHVECIDNPFFGRDHVGRMGRTPIGTMCSVLDPGFDYHHRVSTSSRSRQCCILANLCLRIGAVSVRHLSEMCTFLVHHGFSVLRIGLLHLSHADREVNGGRRSTWHHGNSDGINKGWNLRRGSN